MDTQKLFEELIKYCCKKDGVDRTMFSLSCALGFLAVTNEVNDKEGNLKHLAQVFASQVKLTN